MLSTGLSKVLLPPVALVTEARVPVRRSPRTTSTVKVSLTFNVGELRSVTWPACVSGIETFLSPIGSVMLLNLFWKRNWKVMSSLASPLLSRWISYSAFGSILK